MHADPWTPDGAVREQILRDALHPIDGNREAQTDGASARRVDRAVHADDFTERVHQWAAGVAGIDRGVGLDHVDVHAAPLDLAHQIAPRAADHAGRDARFRVAEEESVRIADRDGPFADDEIIGYAERRDGQALRVDPQDREVVRLIDSDDLGRIGRAVAQGHLHRGGTGHDVRVRDDHSVRTDDEPGPQSLRGAIRAAAEERIEGIAGRRRRLPFAR